ncbi:hypothetical protein ACFWXK_39410 [Streptomyces sp. NPDC059070]|uniref:hypothetical protein n=1 Tax=Streptomyces sp. NPDC059070 TaxID=3346713 RepID=UPI00368CCC58
MGNARPATPRGPPCWSPHARYLRSWDRAHRHRDFNLSDSPGHSPRNFTTSTATVFLEADCEGDVYYVMKPGTKLGDKLKLSSVVFS